MLFVDVKYANMLGPRLKNYKRKSEYLWNFSCPVCGDSKTNKIKARGYIYKVKNSLFVKCHNCSYGGNIGSLIKYMDPIMHHEYILETYQENGVMRSQLRGVPDTVPAIIQAPETVDSILDPIKRLDKLSIDHPAVKYCLKRKIPFKLFHLLYFAPRFKHYVNTCVPNKFKDFSGEHPRLVIPYFNSHGKCFAFQGRAFGKEDPKYYTIKLDDQEKIFGLERVDYSKRVYILEGPIDSLFIPNAIAVSGSSFNSPTIEALKTNATVVYDNEPRSKELTKLIKKTIDQGFSVCLWPDSVDEKDVNEMIMAGKTSQEILDIINANTYNGPEAQLRFSTWRKCE